jgi:hypothetical protein
MFMTPIWPMTTLEGNFERVFAAFIIDGPKKDEPRPATVKLIERIMRTTILLEVPTMLTAMIPAINDNPDNNDARTTKKSMV